MGEAHDQETIKFANQVMRYAEACGIDPSQFLEAAARFGEATGKDDSLAQFMKLCFEHRERGSFGSMALADTAASHIRGVRKTLDHEMFVLEKRNQGYLSLFHKYCANKSLSFFAETMASSFRTGRSMKQSPEVFKQQHFVRGKIAFDCLTRYHEVL